MNVFTKLKVSEVFFVLTGIGVLASLPFLASSDDLWLWFVVRVPFVFGLLFFIARR